MKCSARLGLPLLLWATLSAAAAGSAGMADPGTLSLEQLLDVTIVGASKYEQTPEEVAAAATIITREEILAFGWRTLGEALSSLPGIYTTYDRQYSYLGMRGFGLPGDLNTRVLIMINGNRVNDPTFDQGPTGREFPLDLEMIERIEFIPGPGGAVYGQNAMLGVVNVITRSGARIHGAELSAAYEGPEGLRQGRATFGKSFGAGVDVVISATGLRSRGEDRFFNFGASGISGIAAGMDGERNQQFFASVAAGSWTLEQVYGNHTKDDPTAAFLSDPLVAGDYQGDRHALTQLRFQHSYAGDSLQVSGRAFDGNERFRSMLNYGTPLLSPADSRWHGAELSVLSTALRRHKLMLGLETQNNTQENQAATYPAAPAGDVFIARRGYRIGLYAQDEWRATQSVSATIGMRLDRNNETADHVSPRVGLIWQTAADTTLKALYGTAYRAPNVYESDFGDGITQTANPGLRNESIDTLELVADHRIRHDLSLRVSAYRWSMQDLITLGTDPLTGLSQYQSGETARARGMEVSIDQTWASGARLRASLSAQNAAYVSGRELANSPKILGKLNWSTPLPLAGLRAGYEMRYDSRRRSIDGTELGAYAFSNLLLSADRLVPDADLTLGLYNLFDKRYAQPGAATNWQNAFQQDGRSIMLKITVKF